MPGHASSLAQGPFSKRREPSLAGPRGGPVAAPRWCAVSGCGGQKGARRAAEVWSPPTGPESPGARTDTGSQATPHTHTQNPWGRDQEPAFVHPPRFETCLWEVTVLPQFRPLCADKHYVTVFICFITCHHHTQCGGPDTRNLSSRAWFCRLEVQDQGLLRTRSLACTWPSSSGTFHGLPVCLCPSLSL